MVDLASIEQADAETMWFSCPYNRAHFSPAPRLEWHITRCHKDEKKDNYKTCRNNSTHLVEAPELDDHYANCINSAETVNEHTLMRFNDEELQDLIESGTGTYPIGKKRFVVTYKDAKCLRCRMLNPQILFEDTKKLLQNFTAKKEGEEVVVLRKDDPNFTPGKSGATRRERRDNRHNPMGRNDQRGTRDDRGESRNDRGDNRRGDRRDCEWGNRREGRRGERRDDGWDDKREDGKEKRTEERGREERREQRTEERGEEPKKKDVIVLEDLDDGIF